MILVFFQNRVNALFHAIDENLRKRILISRSQKNFAEIFLIFPIFFSDTKNYRVGYPLSYLILEDIQKQLEMFRLIKLTLILLLVA